jgi:NAD-dependent dihydropyrimidine dehydrogenase PreA subunit
MAEENHIHYVATLDEARALLRGKTTFWVSNCGCREGKGECGQSRMDVCVCIEESFPPTGSGRRQIGPREVEGILQEAREKLLVPRPFRDMETLTRTAGVCFCCADCCSYFANPTEPCDKGASIELTDLKACTGCGDCIEVCHFGARAEADEAVEVKRDRCYGCGVCVEVCPEECIEMVPR